MRATILVRVGQHELSITNVDKLYWPDDGITKGDYLAYCQRIAPWLLPHLAQRPLVLTRYPDGAYGQWFYQKNAPPYTPDWVDLYPYWSQDAQRWVHFVVCRDVETLIWIANQGAIELHPWLSRTGDPEHPDFAVVDLDPAEGTGFREAVQVALLLREILQHLGLRGYAKTSGATGIHVYIPLERRYDYALCAEFVRRLGLVLRTQAPELVTLERMVRKRTGRVYVDYLQNALGKTLVSVYSTRPKPGAPVSFPISWDDLPYVHPGDFNLRSVPDLLAQDGDSFSAVLTDQQKLDEPWRRLALLLDRPNGGDR